MLHSGTIPNIRSTYLPLSGHRSPIPTNLGLSLSSEGPRRPSFWPNVTSISGVIQGSRRSESSPQLLPEPCCCRHPAHRRSRQH